jgi:hypothetical protein
MDEPFTETIDHLRAETLLMLRSDRGEMTLLWKKLCAIADELGKKNKLTFHECWKIFDTSLNVGNSQHMG